MAVFETPPLSGDRQKRVWAQLILRSISGDSAVTVTGNWDSQTRAGFRRFQDEMQIRVPGRDGDWTPQTTYALTQLGLEWILGERIENRLGVTGDGLRAAVRRFQRAYRLTEDGDVGPQVRQVMIEIILGRRPGLDPGRHFRLGMLKAASPGAGASLGAASPGRLFTDFSDPAAVRLVERIERTVCGDEQCDDDDIIIDVDETQPVAEPWALPYRWSCLLLLQYRHPVTGAALFGGASGFLISPQHVVTAAHALLSLTRLEDMRQDTLLYAERVVVIPAFSACRRVLICTGARGDTCIRTKRPFGWVVAERRGFKIPVPYARQEADQWIVDNNFDYAVLDLGVTIGKRVVSFVSPVGKKVTLGWWGKDGTSSTVRPFRLATELDGKRIHIAGYPGYAGGRQIYATGTASFDEHFTAGRALGDLARITGPNQFVHDANTSQGHSGSPIWEKRTEGGQTRRRLLGVDTLLFDRLLVPSMFDPADELQGGVAVTQAVWRDIQRWTKSDEQERFARSRPYATV